MAKEFDSDSLSKVNGQDGKTAYVGFKDVVYDVSDSQKWKAGTHMNRHHAGADSHYRYQECPLTLGWLLSGLQKLAV